MKTNTTTQRNTYTFTITKTDVNEFKRLLPSVLYTKMESTAQLLLKSLEEQKETQQHLFKLNVLKDAYLNDRLKITHTVQKLNAQEIIFTVVVSKENSIKNDTICVATFGFSIKDKIQLELAS